MDNEILEGKKYPLDLLIIIVLSLFGVLGALFLADGNIIRIIFGVPLLLFIPGYSLVSVLWPSKGYLAESRKSFFNLGKGHLDNVERIALSVGLSIVLVTLIGVILNFISTFSLVPILMALLIFTLACSLIAWYVRTHISENDRFYISLNLNSEALFPKESKADKALAIILIIAIIISACIMVYMIITPVESSSFTEFYILDQNHSFANIPNNLSLNETGNVFINIVNHENSEVQYTLIASLGNNSLPLVHDESSIIMISKSQNTDTGANINHDESFEQNYEFSFSEPGRYRLTWQLLLDGKESNYEIHKWIDVS